MPDQIATVDLRSMTVTRRFNAPGGIAFRAMTLDPVRRNLVLVGNRSHDHEVVEAQLRLRTRQFGRVQVIRSSASGDFRVNAVSIATDGSVAVIAYHGTNTTGADAFTLPTWNDCHSNDRHSGCLTAAHGTAILIRGETFATTGTPPAVAVFRDRVEIARIRLQPSAHVTALAVEPDARVAWVPGACDAPRGIWRVDLRRRRASRYFSGLPTRLTPDPPCGYTLELSSDARWAVTTETALPVPDPERSGSVWMFSLRSGTRKVMQVPIASDPVAATFVR
jgi:hypothetical protein